MSESLVSAQHKFGDFFSMEEVNRLVADIKSGNLKPIYFLMGEEPYYIDKISNYIENNVLADNEKGFNQIVLYGRDTSVEDIISNAKRFPMMANRQVVIVKEAQDLSKTIENLTTYAQNPQPTTVLVINYKYNKIDKRKGLYKALINENIVFESKKLYENKIAEWIRQTLLTKGYAITPKAAQMLVEFLGTDLSKINNELEKLQLIIQTGTTVTPELIEENIGISKDYNNFELKKAVGNKNHLKAYKIIKYFADNPKENPMVLTLALLFNFFSQLLYLHGLQDKSPKSVASKLKVNPYFVNEYLTAARNYPMKKVSFVIALLREFDLKIKGVGANSIPEKDLLKELLVKILD